MGHGNINWHASGCNPTPNWRKSAARRRDSEAASVGSGSLAVVIVTDTLDNENVLSDISGSYGEDEGWRTSSDEEDAVEAAGGFAGNYGDEDAAEEAHNSYNSGAQPIQDI
ncbi:hypothetical protein VOLCADRAFT_90355 [Volvox carteri f. nagariensis]|uniref:Uncharacterized protein n=1 Tax=Volvox carteri f. nagariensis TaxID=3068 RepID=D8TU56_VOLCA|nr:uncharacterized protein VOLCADRAFT_90355 [Volvox carteri f. nagariensis]EFJ48981.1 hypothetical protein VOLCADRAFT_90355 [Volvox carteri f. nagariensis]|eukprot:XP_002949878.1 hypothetical protein VOLCADRAFT_90355 [Volvox carteri f. nagariensis]